MRKYHACANNILLEEHASPMTTAHTLLLMYYMDSMETAIPGPVKSRNTKNMKIMKI